MAILYGFHAVSARVKTAPASVEEVLVDQHRKDKRMQQFIDKVKAAGVQVSCTVHEGMWHNFQMFNALVEKADKALWAIADFVRRGEQE